MPLKTRVDFFVTAPLYSFWDSNVLLVQKAGVSSMPFSYVCGTEYLFVAGDCDTGPLWHVTTAGFLMHSCTQVPFRN